MCLNQWSVVTPRAGLIVVPSVHRMPARPRGRACRDVGRWSLSRRRRRLLVCLEAWSSVRPRLIVPAAGRRLLFLAHQDRLGAWS